MQLPPRAQTHGPALIRLLSRLGSTDAPAPSQSFSARLAQWIDWPQAVALSAALDARATSPTGSDTDAPGDDGECARVRAMLVSAIEGDRAFATPGASTGAAASANTTMQAGLADAAFHRQRYIALQQLMEAEIRHLRGRLRGRLLKQAGHMRRLAAMDSVMEQALGPRERALLAPLPDVLGKHFERLQQAAETPDAAADIHSSASPPWLALFREDMQRLLLAELDLRMQPLQGLTAALRTCPAGHHAQ